MSQANLAKSSELKTNNSKFAVSSYDSFSKWMHWTMAIIIIYATLAGYSMLLVMDKPKLFHTLSIINMSVATVAAVLLLFRWVWSFFRVEPELPDTIPTVQKKIAKLAHSVIYLIMLVVFVSGFLMLTHSYELFGLFTIPNPISNPEINQFFFMVHRVSCALLAGLIVLHIFAALKHHFVNKNNVLKSMVS